MLEALFREPRSVEADAAGDFASDRSVITGIGCPSRPPHARRLVTISVPPRVGSHWRSTLPHRGTVMGRSLAALDERGVDAMSMQSVEERREFGRAARQRAPRSSHREWAPVPNRGDPVSLLEEQNATRIPWLVPLRHARMRVSPFTFYRGTAKIMVADLASTPTSGIDAQIGGDAHLSNFGAYASPERKLVFDANDFDETLRGPWEWDLKRLATSFTIAGQYLGLSAEVCRDAAAHSVQSYREAMAEFASMRLLGLWYDHVDVDDLRTAGGMKKKELNRRVTRFERKARRKNSLQALRKLTVEVDGRRQIRNNPPVLFPLRDLPPGYDTAALEEEALGAIESYKSTLSDDRHWLLDQYTVADVGIKVVGVGSVGTRCSIILLQGRDGDDPLFLQAKEAGPSVLEDHLGPSRYGNHGQRVVEGQRMIQAQSDIFLGWAKGPGGAHLYVRQLRDWKGSIDTEAGTPNQLRFYARLCGQTMARGHARSGDPVAIRAYLGKGHSMDRAVAAFADQYAKQNLDDYRRFTAAIDDGRLEVADTI